MSVEVIPAIIAKNFKELKEKIEKVEPYVKWVQIDIMDGKFVPNTTWNEPEDLSSWNSKVFPEAHLMIQEPEKYVARWIDGGIKRIIFHIEATSNPHAIIQKCREKKVGVGVAINPETFIERIEPLLELSFNRASRTVANGRELFGIDMVLVLGVTPGFGGQEFKPEALEKIKALRRSHPHLTIGVDGGMNPKTAKQAIEAGASIVVSGSYILESKDVEKAIDEMRGAINL